MLWGASDGEEGPERRAPGGEEVKMAGKKKNWRTKKARNRIFVHPQEDVLQCEEGVFAPGQRVPDHIADSDMGADWFHSGLLIEESMYRMYHGADWNARHPTDRVKPGEGGVDIHHVVPDTGDEITRADGKAPLIGGETAPELGD